MTNLDSILKSRDITWPTKVRLVKPVVFPWNQLYSEKLDSFSQAMTLEITVWELWVL